MMLEAQNLDKTALHKYRSRNRSHHVYRAASKLWAATGMPWAEALGIVNSAFDACIQDG